MVGIRRTDAAGINAEQGVLNAGALRNHCGRFQPWLLRLNG